MHLFYTPDIGEALRDTVAQHYTLSEEESRHCVKVLRLQEGVQVQLLDGKGTVYRASILEAHARRCKLQLLEKRFFEARPYRLHIAIAPTKNIDRFEWFLEKATEVGIDEITPVICQRSERRQLRADRLFKRITAAMKQSQQAWHPLLNEALSFKDFIDGVAVGAIGGTGKAGVSSGFNDSSVSPFGLRCIAHCGEGGKRHLGALNPLEKPVLAMIGPEGDFTPEEIQMAEVQGFQPLDLGNSRLRTETAGLAVCFEMALLHH